MQVAMEILKGDNAFLHDDSLCRVCLSSSEENKCIFTTHMIVENYHLTNVWKKLQFYGGIEVRQTDGFPSRICNRCISKLRVIEEFRKQCQESDEKLRLVRKKQKSENLEFDKMNKIYTEKQNITKIKENCAECISQNTKSIMEEGSIIRIRAQIARAIARQQELESMEQSTSKGYGKVCTIVDKQSMIPVDGQSLSSIAQKCRNFELEEVENSVQEQKKKQRKQLLNFRRITSIENLKKYKERQRQYVKRTRSAENPDDNQIKKSCRVSTQQLQSDLEISQYKSTKCCRTHESETFLEEHESSHCPERFHQPVEFPDDSEPLRSNSKTKASICKICNKKFRKALTMVRHLHVHKRENPRAVYAILKEIRDKKTNYESTFPNENDEDLEIMKKVRDDENSEESTRDRQAMSEQSNIVVNRPNNTEISIVSQSDEIPEKSDIPCDDRSAIKLINSWIREELDSENEGKGFPCVKCNKSYVTKKSLAKHVTKMHDEFSRCNPCLEHYNRIQGNSEITETPREHRCNVCDKTFEHGTKLEKHMKIHKREKEAEDKDFKRFLCHICSKTFRLNTGLKFHMRTHTGYKPHVCKYCGRGFSSNSNCINHERTHTGDRPFVCHFCSAAFAKSCTLKAHITTHTGEANYHCKTCGKSFRRLKYLKEHRFTHTGEKPYVCKICGAAYSHSGSLFVHEKKCKAQHNDCPDVIQHFTNDKTTAYQPNLAAPILDNQNVMDALENTNEDEIMMNEGINCINDDIHSSHLRLPTNTQSFLNIGHIYQS